MYVEAIIGIIIALIVFFAVFYIIRSKRKGAHCIGCPYANSCKKPSCDGSDSEKSEQ